MITLGLVSTSSLRFGDLIRRTLSTLKERPLFFFGLTAATIVPSTLFEWWSDKIVSDIISSFLSAALFGAVAFAVFNKQNNNDVSPGQALSQTLNWPLLCFASFWALFSILVLVLLDWDDQQGVNLAGVSAFVMSLALYGVLFAFFLPVIPVCTVEKLGFEAGIQRSLKLTDSHRRRIFFIVVALGCLLLLLIILLFFGLILLPGGELFLFLIKMNRPPVTPAQLCVSMAYMTFIILIEAFSVTLYSIVYCDLRNMEQTLPV